MYSKYFKKQKMMRTVLIALAPIVVYGVYVFGWRTLALLAFNIVVASLVEYISEKTMYNRSQVTEAAFVTATLFTLTLPPHVSFFVSGVGVAVGIFFGKEVFGGFGKNVFNPAIVGRTFVYINFAKPMLTWSEAANSERLINGLAGFTKWITPTIDNMSNPTPLRDFATNGIVGDQANIMKLLFGNHGGSIGEISIVLIVLGALYMIYKKIASWESMVATLIGFVGSSYLFIMLGAGDKVLPPLYGMLVGGLMFGTAFMVTDPVSSPKQPQAKWIYGILIGFIVVVIRSFGSFQEGMMFAILISSVFSPIIDYVYDGINKKKKLAKKAAQAKAVNNAK